MQSPGGRVNHLIFPVLFYKVSCKREISFSFTSGLSGQMSQVLGSHHNQVSRLKKSLPSLKGASQLPLLLTSLRVKQRKRGSHTEVVTSMCLNPLTICGVGLSCDPT